jgi:hypothetical protein
VLPCLDSGYNLARWLLRGLRYLAALREGASGRWFLAIVRNPCFTHLAERRSRPEQAGYEVWPAGTQRAPLRQRLRGFTALHWVEAGMQAWVVSDQDAAEIERFGVAWRAQAAAAAKP